MWVHAVLQDLLTTSRCGTWGLARSVELGLNVLLVFDNNIFVVDTWRLYRRRLNCVVVHNGNMLKDFLRFQVLRELSDVGLSGQMAFALLMVVVFAGKIRDGWSKFHLVNLTTVVSIFLGSLLVVIFLVLFQCGVLFCQFQVLHLKICDVVDLSL